MNQFKNFSAKDHHFDCAHIQEVRIQHIWFGLMPGPAHAYVKFSSASGKQFHAARHAKHQVMRQSYPYSKRTLVYSYC